MMFGFYRAEMLKLRHTKMFLTVLVPAVISNLVSLLMLLPQVSMSGDKVSANLQAVFYRQGNIITILGPFIFALVTGYVFAREYNERTINQLFTYPVSRIRIFNAKMAVIFTIIVITSLLSCAFAVLIGVAKVLGGYVSFNLILGGIGMNLVACLFSFGTIPLAAAFSLVGKNIIPPMVLGALASMVTLVLELGHGMKAVLFPWATPYYLVREFGEGFSETGQNQYIGTALVILSLTFLLSLIFCLLHYSKSEVHSGS
ncbi:MAG: ABC transporter permease [Ethanoligenens sp.]